MLKPPGGSNAPVIGVDVHNVRDYGASGNGTDDDRSAIQAALNRTSVTGGIVYLPAGTYTLSGALTAYGASQIVGAHYKKTKLILRSGANSSVIVSPDDGTQRTGLEIRDMWLDGNASAQSGSSPVIDIRAMNEARLDKLWITNARGDSIHVGQATVGMFCTVPIITSVWIRSDTTYTQGNGIFLDSGSSDAIVAFCDIGYNRASGKAGIAMSGHNGAVLTSNNCWQNNYGYLWFQSNRTRVVGCLADYAKLHGFVAQESSDLQFIGCQARNSSDTVFSGGTTLTGDGFNISGAASDVLLVGCRAMGPNTRYGLNAATITRLTVQAQNFAGVGTAGFNLSSCTASHPEFLGTSASASAGSNGAVPAQVAGYVLTDVAGTTVKVPYFL